MGLVEIRGRVFVSRKATNYPPFIRLKLIPVVRITLFPKQT